MLSPNCTLFQTCGRQPTPHRARQGCGKGLCAEGQARRVHACPCRAQRERARRLRGASHHSQRMPTIPRQGPEQRCCVPWGNNAHVPRRSPFRAPAQGSGPSPPGWAVSPAGTTFVGGRRCHFLLLASRKRLLAGALWLGCPGEEAPAKRWVFGGLCSVGQRASAPQGMDSLLLDSRWKPRPREGNV